jgi:hypothetical protein
LPSGLTGSPAHGVHIRNGRLGQGDDARDVDALRAAWKPRSVWLIIDSIEVDFGNRIRDQWIPPIYGNPAWSGRSAMVADTGSGILE